MNIFGSRLRESRKAKNISVKEIAAFLSITSRAYQYYETGERFPDGNRLLSIAEYLGISLDYLFGRTENPEVNR